MACAKKWHQGVLGERRLHEGHAMKNRLPAALMTIVGMAFSASVAADVTPMTLRDGRIGYVMTNLFWSVYQTPDAKEECPKGFNDGPREQFEILFPDVENRT